MEFRQIHPVVLQGVLNKSESLKHKSVRRRFFLPSPFRLLIKPRNISQFNPLRQSHMRMILMRFVKRELLRIQRLVKFGQLRASESDLQIDYVGHGENMYASNLNWKRGETFEARAQFPFARAGIHRQRARRKDRNVRGGKAPRLQLLPQTVQKISQSVVYVPNQSERIYPILVLRIV